MIQLNLKFTIFVPSRNNKLINDGKLSLYTVDIYRWDYRYDRKLADWRFGEF